MICPKCKSANIRTERSLVGEIRCLDCDFVIKERGSKEKILPITEQNYPMPLIKEPVKTRMVGFDKWEIGYIKEALFEYDRIVEDRQRRHCSDNDAVQFYENCLKKSKELKKKL